MVQALVIGFDAMDREVARRLMAEGRMPNLARLRAEGVTAEMANPIGMMTGPVWATLVTATHPDRHGRLNWRVLVPGTYRMRWLGEYSRPGTPPFWEALAAQGRTATVVDVPTVELSPLPEIVQLQDWNVHDRRGPLRGHPADVAQEVAERFGLEGIDLCDEQGAAGEHVELRATLVRDLQRYTDGLSWLIR